VTSLRPGLVSLTFAANDFAGFKDISGISIDAAVSCDDTSFRENVLFTHRGLSGPAILQVSSYWQPGKPLHINILPQLDAGHIFSENRQSTVMLPNLLARYLPKRFVQIWCSAIFAELSFIAKPIKQYRDNELHQIASRIHDWQIVPSGTTGYKKAEVTLGGIDTHELSSKTMESRRMPGLYFIGEVVDVTGQLGGYNFQWAWSSGYAAGQVV
jgi:predicted Rossmann fold flavoprotein